MTRRARTSYETTLIPPGFHRGRRQPSAHMAPRLSRLTVPSPSPNLTPLRTCAPDSQSVARRMDRADLDGRLGALIGNADVDPAAPRERHVERRASARALGADGARRVRGVRDSRLVILV